MKTITELNKERLLIRKSDALRSTVIGLLIDGASKKAKTQNREVEERDLYSVAQSSVKEIEKDMEVLREKKHSTIVQEMELNIWKEFLPKLLSKGEIKRMVLQMYNEEALIEANFVKIIKECKVIPDMDMALLNEVLKEILV